MEMGRRLVDLAGLYIVKQIDGFHLKHDATNSMHVYLHLEQVTSMLPNDLLNLRNVKAIQSWLGKRHGITRPYKKVSIEAGKLALFDIGQVVLDGYLIGALAEEQKVVKCINPRPCGSKDIAKLRKLPRYWKSDDDILTRLEYSMGTTNKSNYLLFWHDDVEYVLPSMVVFKAFYSASSEFINAILGRPWQQAIRMLIDPEKSNLDAQFSQAGPLKLLQAVEPSRAMLHQLALFLYDKHANKCISALHSDWVRRGGHVWWNTAQVPHDTTRGLELSVQGYTLHPYKDRIQRFLITRIVASDWASEIKSIDYLREEAGPNSEKAESKDLLSGKPLSQRIPGDPSVEHVTGTDPDKDSDIHVFNTAPFEYKKPPKIIRIVQTGLPSRQQDGKFGRRKDPAKFVNSGVGAYGKERPAQAEIEQDLRPPSKHLEDLENALQILKKSKIIENYEEEGPSSGSSFFHMRNGHLAWTLAGPCTGWGGTRAGSWPEQKKAPWAWVWEPGESDHKKARALAVYKVTIGEWRGMLLDIERRPTSLGESFRLFLVEPLDKLEDEAMECCLTELRNNEGVLKPQQLLNKAFASLNAKAHAINHSTVKRPQGYNGPRRLHTKSLGTWLLDKAKPSLQRGEWAIRSDCLAALKV